MDLNNQEEVHNLYTGKLFHVRVPSIAVYEEGEAEIWGMNVNEYNGKVIGDETRMRRTVFWPPKRIVDTYIKGQTNISILNIDDVDTLYKILIAYKNHFLDGAVGLMHRGDLKDNSDFLTKELYDDFLAGMFNNNKNHMVSETVKSMNGLFAVGGISSGKISASDFKFKEDERNIDVSNIDINEIMNNQG